MKVFFCTSLLLALSTSAYYYYGVHAQLRTNFFLKSIEHCDPKAHYPINHNCTFWTSKNGQYLNANAVYRVPLDNTKKISAIVELLPGSNVSVYLFTIHERKSCDAIHKYMGEFVYDMERAAGLIPGMCPIPAGRHNLHNLRLHYEKITLQTFPFGNLRFTFNMTDAKNTVTLCLICEAENRQ